jgi:hypothetical protein
MKCMGSHDSTRLLICVAYLGLSYALSRTYPIQHTKKLFPVLASEYMCRGRKEEYKRASKPGSGENQSSQLESQSSLPYQVPA